MSDPRLTAADVAMYAEWLNDERWDGQTAMRFVDSHEALRADVERLTAENAALREERDAAKAELWAVHALKLNLSSVLAADEQKSRELAEVRAEIERLKAERRAIVTIGDLRAIHCQPFEDWRGANDDGRKETK
jgi:uncharacterized small protein (DUF1192 family)